MILYWQIFLALFVPGIVGYGGGPATIPLIQYEVVDRYGWFTLEEFGEILALGNALPGPIATKIAGYVGFQVGGFLGAFVALFATIAPSLLAMLFLLGLLYKFKDSPKVKRMTTLVRPAIAVLLAVMAYQFFSTSWNASIIQMVFLTIISFFLLEKWKVHPAYVIAGALIYGALVIPAMDGLF